MAEAPKGLIWLKTIPQVCGKLLARALWLRNKAPAMPKKNRHERRADSAQARSNPDPLKIFMNAERFRIADLVLRSDKNQNVAVAVAGPALVISAFASELYLKCLICIETGNLEFGHELRPLFKKLSEASQKSIQRRWDAMVATPQRRRIYEALKAVTGEVVPMDLDWALRNGGDGFVELRYLHENEGGTRFLLGDFPQLLRDEILLHKPEWTFLGHGPMKPVPGFEDPLPGFER